MSECEQTVSKEPNVAEISSEKSNYNEGENDRQIIIEYPRLGCGHETVLPQLDNECCVKVSLEEVQDCTLENRSEISKKTVEDIESDLKDCTTQTEEFVSDIDLENVAQNQEEEEEKEEEAMAAAAVAAAAQSASSDNPLLEMLQGLGQTVNEMNMKTQKNLTNEYIVTMPKLKKNELVIPRLSAYLETNSLAIVTAALVANDKELKDVTSQMILSLYCGMFNIYLAFLNVPSIVCYLVKEGYRVHEVSIEEWTTRMSLLRKGVNHIVAHFVGEDLRILSKLSWTLLGPFLCLLGHKPNKTNLHYWGNKMLRTFYTETNLPKERHNVLFHPSLRFCECLTYILEKMCEMRRHMFFVVYNTASTVPRLPGAVCRLAIEQLRGEGLLNFILIDQYLLVQNPFSLLLNSIAKHVSLLLEAYEKYMEFGHLAPWCSVIAPPEDLQIFRHPSIKFVAAVARGLAVREGVTALENYYPTFETEEVRVTVEKALLLLKETRVKQRSNNEEKIIESNIEECLEGEC